MSYIIDLHLDQELEYPLYYQISLFEKAVDDAIYKGYSSIRVIHGIGSGVLKSEIHRILSKHSSVESYINEYHPFYGMGSTKIIFK